jgi:hypothetical protein
MTKEKSDIIGHKIGELTVLHMSPTFKNNEFAWVCGCSCGKIVTVTNSALLHGHVKSCGHLRKDSSANVLDLTGQTFGKLSGIKRAGNTDKGMPLIRPHKQVKKQK